MHLMVRVSLSFYFDDTCEQEVAVSMGLGAWK